jgi:hypothetical protein
MFAVDLAWRVRPFKHWKENAGWNWMRKLIQR